MRRSTSELSCLDGSPQPVKLKREVEYEQLWNVEARRSSSSSSASSKSGDDDVDGGSEEALATSQSSSQGPVSLPYFGVEPRPGNVLGLGRKEGLPPSPPPRPGKTHNRSASLDLNKLSTKQSLPSIPPRASPYHKTSDTGQSGLIPPSLSISPSLCVQVMTMMPGIPRSCQRVFTDTKKVLRFCPGQFRSYHR